MSNYTKNKRFIDIYNSGTGSIAWSSSVSDAWIKLSETSGEMTKEKRLWVTIDWDAAPKGEVQTGTITITGAGTAIPITVSLFNPASPLPGQIRGFAESHGYVCMEAEHYSRKTDKDNCAWALLANLGRTGRHSVTVLPALVPSQTTPAAVLANSPSLEYDFYLFNPGPVTLAIHSIPTYPINNQHGLRIAVAFDDGTPEIRDANWRSRSPFENTMQFASLTNTLSTKGQHVLKVWMVDPGVVLDKFVLISKGIQDSYLGPPESFFHQADPTP